MKVNGYSLYWRKRNKHGGVIICYSNESIECKNVSFEGVPDNYKIVMPIKTRKLLCIGLFKSLHKIKSISLTMCL